MDTPSARRPSVARALLIFGVGLTLAGCDTLGELSGDTKVSPSHGHAKKKKKTKTNKAKKVDCAEQCPCECPEAKVETPPNQEPYPMVFAGNIKVAEGPLSNELAATKVNAQRYSLRECYAPALKKDPTIKGEMDVQFTISGETGKVIAAIVRQSTINDKTIEGCVTRKAKEWSFPKDDRKRKTRESVVKFTVLMLAVSL